LYASHPSTAVQVCKINELTACGTEPNRAPPSSTDRTCSKASSIFSRRDLQNSDEGATHLLFVVEAAVLGGGLDSILRFHKPARCHQQMRWQPVTDGGTQDEPRHFFRRSKRHWPLIAPHNPTRTILDLHNDEAALKFGRFAPGEIDPSTLREDAQRPLRIGKKIASYFEMLRVLTGDFCKALGRSARHAIPKEMIALVTQ
jgi:hypothetical protein